MKCTCLFSHTFFSCTTICMFNCLALADMCYSLPVNSFMNIFFSLKILLDIHSGQLTLFIPISNRYIIYSYKHSNPNIQSHHSDFPDFLLRSPIQKCLRIPAINWFPNTRTHVRSSEWLETKVKSPIFLKDRPGTH
jgi:hypothetical protein